MSSTVRATIVGKVLDERDRQDSLWGSQRNHSDAWWNVIASEENGEVAREVYEQNEEKLLVELVSVLKVLLVGLQVYFQKLKQLFVILIFLLVILYVRKILLKLLMKQRKKS